MDVGGVANDLALRIGIDDPSLKRSTRRAEGFMRRWARGAARGVSDTLRGGFMGLGAIGAFGGISSLTNTFRQVKTFEEKLVRLGNSTNESAASMALFKQQVFETAKAMAVSPDDLVDGMADLVRLTGDFENARNIMGSMAKVAAASGAPMKDVATATAALMQQFKIVKPEDIEAAFSGMMALGEAKGTSIELNQLAGELSGLSSGILQFKTQGLPALTELGVAMQVIGRGASGDVEKTRTRMESLFKSITSSQGVKRLQKAGIKVFDVKDGKRQLRSFEDIIFDIQGKIGKDPLKLAQAIPDMEAGQAMRQLVKVTKEEWDLLKKAAGSTEELDRDFKSFSESAAGAFARTSADLDRIANEQIAKHLPGIADSMNKIAGAIDWMANNKAATIAIFAALKGLQLGAGVGVDMMLGGRGGAGGTGGGAGVARGAAGALGLALPIAGIATAAVAGGVLAYKSTDYAKGVDARIDEQRARYGPWAEQYSRAAANDPRDRSNPFSVASRQNIPESIRGRFANEAAYRRDLIDRTTPEQRAQVDAMMMTALTALAAEVRSIRGIGVNVSAGPGLAAEVKNDPKIRRSR